MLKVVFFYRVIGRAVGPINIKRSFKSFYKIANKKV